jgi:hypothetical protein
VKEGAEPVDFTSAFFGWDKSSSGVSPSTTLVKTRRKLELRTDSVQASSESASDALSQYSKTFSIEELREKEKLPSTVDKSQLEMYLSESDFMKYFGMNKDGWTKTPAWKKTPKKKELGLF